jgi:hypothetical protein
MVKELQQEPGKSMKEIVEELEAEKENLLATTAIAASATEEAEEDELENEEGANEGGYQGHDLRSGYVRGKGRD